MTVTSSMTKLLMLAGKRVQAILLCIASHQEPQQVYHARIILSTTPSVFLVLPGELAKHAVSEGTKAVTKFTSN